MADEAHFRLPGLQIAQRAVRPLRFPLPPTADLQRLKVAVRSETPDDLPFLMQLYAESRAAEMVMINNWDSETKRDFVEKQFSYQYHHYSTYYADADFAVVLCDGRPIGKMGLWWGLGGARDCRLFDFQLTGEMRNRGIGGALTAALLRLAQSMKFTVSLHVDPMNGARRLYSRFGFQVAEGGGGSGGLLMRWSDGPVVSGVRAAV